MDKNYNYNFENRYNDPVNKVSSEILNMNSCKESDLPKTPAKDRFYHTTDTNKFFYDWNRKRYQLNILNSGSSDELTKELEKIKEDIAKLDPDKIDALEGKVNDAAKKADEAATKANDAASKAQEVTSTITDKASTEYVDNKFAEIKSITNVETVENGYTLVLSDGSSLSVKNGVDGAKGDKGDTGEMGPQGPQGEKGEQGLQGLPGEKGADGKDGAQGIQGEKGEKGDTGEQGPQGIQGEKGADGAKGDTGAAFTYDMFTEEQLAGLKGPKGDKGDTGETGPEGPQGPQGEKGADGAKGDTGAAFTYDMFTEEQLAGLKGPKGDKGDTGETGPEGPQGPQGEKGADGKDGAGLTDEDKVKLEKLDSIPDNLNEGTFPTIDDSGNVNDDATAGLATVDKVVAYINEVLKKKSSEITTDTKDYVYISGSRYVDDQTKPTPIYTMNCFEIDADALDEDKGIEIISDDEIVGYLSDDSTDGTTSYSQLFSIDVPDEYAVELHMWDDDTKAYFKEVFPVEANPRYSQKKYGDKTYDSYIRQIRNSSVDDPTHRYYDVDVIVSTARWKVVLKKKDIKDV